MNDQIIDKVVTAAYEARSLSYAPYSDFKMGAAILTDKDKIISGSLVENVSLGLAMCAERIALFSSVSQDAGKPLILVLVSERTDGKITFPCGACLQVALELGGPKLEIIASDLSKNIERNKIIDLALRLPHKTNKLYNLDD
ncbi:MAG: cytidine deaminase [Candidatus Dadabacteria bacterium]|nr:cytidine deaminase [Candidatus Dadabacteria bacterium]NIT13125.1 cytidine deaminase [Candidatus Dadabacteria bacterium]